jgi:hypothetical protein
MVPVCQLKPVTHVQHSLRTDHGCVLTCVLQGCPKHARSAEPNKPAAASTDDINLDSYQMFSGWLGSSPSKADNKVGHLQLLHLP